MKILADFGWSPGRHGHFQCAGCKDRFIATSSTAPNMFLGSRDSTHCHPCATAAHKSYAARDFDTERLVAHKALSNAILDDLPAALADGGGGLEAALDRVGAALQAWRALG